MPTRKSGKRAARSKSRRSCASSSRCVGLLVCVGGGTFWLVAGRDERVGCCLKIKSKQASKVNRRQERGEVFCLVGISFCFLSHKSCVCLLLQPFCSAAAGALTSMPPPGSSRQQRAPLQQKQEQQGSTQQLQPQRLLIVAHVAQLAVGGWWLSLNGWLILWKACSQLASKPTHAYYPLRLLLRGVVAGAATLVLLQPTAAAVCVVSAGSVPALCCMASQQQQQRSSSISATTSVARAARGGWRLLQWAQWQAVGASRQEEEACILPKYISL